MARTQEQRKAETRGRLLAAAAELFARQGFHAVSTDAVADAADRTSGSVYAHFGGKEGLLFALLNSWEGEAAERIGTALDHTGPTDRSRALWRTFVEAPEDAWMLLEHELWLYVVRHPELSGEIAGRYAAGRAGMAEAFARWSDERGSELPLPAAETAVLVMALLLGLEMQRRVDPTSVPDDIAVRGLDLLLGHQPTTHERKHHADRDL